MGNYDELPQEIMFDIMCRVPAKSVGLCRCVSKPWRALLSQPNFIKAHLQHTKINSLESLLMGYPKIDGDSGSSFRMMMSAGYDLYVAPLNNARHMLDEITLPITKLSFPGYNSLSFIRIHGSCDGLLLAKTYGRYGGKMVVMNPFTREIRQVRRKYHHSHKGTYDYLYGFGYDSVRDDYKIVIITVRYSRRNDRFFVNEALFDVYSLKTGSWKRLENPPYNYVLETIKTGAFVGGFFHWLYNRDIDDKLAIVSFDLVDEKFREVPLPSSISDNLEGYYKTNVGFYQLGVLDGCLCMSYAKSEVWVMKEYGVAESWTKFPVNQPDGLFRRFLTFQEQVVMHIYLDEYNKYFKMWNLRHGTLKKIVPNGFSGRSGKLFILTSFIESLVSPHG